MRSLRKFQAADGKFQDRAGTSWAGLHVDVPVVGVDDSFSDRPSAGALAL
jgi:hypothetical protein